MIELVNNIKHQLRTHHEAKVKKEFYGEHIGRDCTTDATEGTG